MPTCVNCLNIVSTNCIRSEQELSFDYEDLNDLLKKLDEKSEEIKKALTQNVDKRWIKEDYEYVTGYIQELINKMDVLLNAPKAEDPKFLIPSGITGTGEKSLLQILTILIKEVEALKAKSSQNSSQLYIANV